MLTSILFFALYTEELVYALILLTCYREKWEGICRRITNSPKRQTVHNQNNIKTLQKWSVTQTNTDQLVTQTIRTTTVIQPVRLA